MKYLHFEIIVIQQSNGHLSWPPSRQGFQHINRPQGGSPAITLFCTANIGPTKVGITTKHRHCDRYFSNEQRIYKKDENTILSPELLCINLNKNIRSKCRWWVSIHTYLNQGLKENSIHTSDHLRYAQINVHDHVLFVAALLQNNQCNHFSAKKGGE